MHIMGLIKYEMRTNDMIRSFETLIVNLFLIVTERMKIFKIMQNVLSLPKSRFWLQCF